MTVNPKESGAIPSLSAYFESLVGNEGEVDDIGPSDGLRSITNQSEKVGGDMEGEEAGECEEEGACSSGGDHSSDWATSDGSGSHSSQGNGDDNQGDKPPYYHYNDYVPAINRIRTRLEHILGGGALSEIVAKLDGFENVLADPEGDSPCTIFDDIATVFHERGDSEGAEMAMREGIGTRRYGDNFSCHESLGYLMAARGDLA